MSAQVTRAVRRDARDSRVLGENALVFSVTDEPARLFPGCVHAPRALVPQLPLVGYEREAHLDAAMAARFGWATARGDVG